MAFSPFLSAASQSSADLDGVDFDWLPDSTNIKLWHVSELPSDSCGDGSPTSPPLPPTIIRQSNNNFLSHQSFSLLNPILQTNDLQYTVSSSSPPPSAAAAAADLLNRPFFPGGDVQGNNTNNNNNNNGRAESPVSCESSITIIEGMSRACRYSPEERKQKIERYRNKRNRRNFNKKIKYACRKSLADSRPRIRGRFARYNDDDIVKNYPVQWSSHGREEDQDQKEANNGGDNWIKYFIDTYSSNLIP